MKIVHATECAASGTLSVIVSLVHELAATGARQVIVYSERPETPADLTTLFPAGVEFVRIAPASGLHVKFVVEFWRALAGVVRTFEPDVLHLHSSKAGFIGRFAHRAMRWRCRAFYSPHGLSFLDPERRVRNAIFESLERVAARTGATPVGCGRGEAQLLSQLTGRAALLLENPVDERFFDIESRAPQPRTVVTLGRLSRQKAPESFAAVARAVRAQRPDVRFVWIGDGESNYRPVLEAAGCEVTGWRNREQVAGLLAGAHVYLQTSRWEGLPISVIQAMAAGVPCVVNDCIGNRDAVTHGSSGLVGDSIEALTRQVVTLADDAALRARMGAAARIEARRRFGAHAFRAQVRKLYSPARIPEHMNKVLVCRAGVLPYSETFIREQLLACTRWKPVLVGTHRVEPGLPVDGIDVRLLHSATPTLRSRIYKRILRELHVAPPGGARRLLAENAALVHVHFGTDAVDYWPLLRRLNLPVIVTLHGFDINVHEHVWQRDRTSLANRRYPDRLIALSRQRGVHFVAVSEAIRQRAIEFGLAPEAITVRYIGVDRKRFAFSGVPVAARPRRILYVGRLVEKKGGELLIRAFAQVRKQVPDAELVMAGDGPLEARLREVASQLGVDVSFLGSVSSAEVKRQFDTARVFCLPSVTAANGDAEGLPISILEAQACGVPVVTSARGGATEGILPGVSGFAFPEGDVAALGDRMAKLLQDDTLATFMSAAAMAFIADRFDIVHCTRALEDLYDAQLREYAPPAGILAEVGPPG
jgi:glycosyltransferase involved in cell wall biosynthesis